MIPTINALAVPGVVSLPGMMTGQILAGSSPTLAAQFPSGVDTHRRDRSHRSGNRAVVSEDFLYRRCPTIASRTCLALVALRRGCTFSNHANRPARVAIARRPIDNYPQ